MHLVPTQSRRSVAHGLLAICLTTAHIPFKASAELLAKIDLGGRNLAGATDADTLSGVDALPAPVGSSCVAITPVLLKLAARGSEADLLGSLRAFLRSKSVPAGSPAPVTELLGSLTHPASDN